MNTSCEMIAATSSSSCVGHEVGTSWSPQRIHALRPQEKGQHPTSHWCVYVGYIYIEIMASVDFDHM
jgi:hypothetical protein